MVIGKLLYAIDAIVAGSIVRLSTFPAAVYFTRPVPVQRINLGNNCQHLQYS